MPHSGSIDVSPIATTDPLDVAEDAPAPDISIEADPQLSEAAGAVTAPAAAEADIVISVVAESAPAAQPVDSVSDAPSPEMSTEAEPTVAEQTSVSSVEVKTEPVEVSEAAVSVPQAAQLPANVASVGTEEAAVQAVDVQHEPADFPEPVVSGSPSQEASPRIELAIADETPVSSADAGIAPVVSENLVVSHEPSSGVLVRVEPAMVDSPAADAGIETSDAAAVTAVAAEASSADIPGVAPDITPEPVLASPAPETRSAPKVRTRAAEPADRAALIRQRWAETGIRMWNPRLHGTGDATLNIQGRVELLPPAPGETMPRYDKLEFRMLGGQIVCESVIVEAPAQAAHRSFTRLAEPVKPDRLREPARERQAALA